MPKDGIFQTLYKPKTINHFAVIFETDIFTITDGALKHKKKDFRSYCKIMPYFLHISLPAFSAISKVRIPFPIRFMVLTATDSPNSSATIRLIFPKSLAASGEYFKQLRNHQKIF